MSERDEILAAVAYWVRYYRKQQGLSQLELAVRVGVDTRLVGRIEQQQNVPSLVLAVQLARALSTSLDDLIQPRPSLPSK